METSLQNFKRKNSNPLRHSKGKRTAGEYDEDDLSLLTDTLRLIDSLYELRFVEKLARPTDKKVKEQEVANFASKMDSLHSKLERIRAELEGNDGDNANTKGKSVMGSATYHVADWKKSIRAIENRYIEVFMEGSFKHYKKLCAWQNFRYTLKIINIEEWASVCLQQQNKHPDCC